MGDTEKNVGMTGRYLGVPEEMQINDATSQNLSLQNNKEEKTEPEEHATIVEKQDWTMPELFLFFCCSLLYLEVVFHICHFGMPERDFIYSCLFVPAAAGIAAFLSSFGSRAVRRAVSFILQAAASLLYMAQQVYCHVFKTYLTVFSVMTGTGQVLEFWREILLAVCRSIPWLLLYLLPVAALAVFWYGERRWRERHVPVRPDPKDSVQAGRGRQWLWRGLFLAAAAAFHVGAVAGLSLMGTDYYTPYDLYHYTSAIDISMRKLGVLTTMRLDMKRLMFGTEEFPAVVAADLPEQEDPTIGEVTEPAREEQIQKEPSGGSQTEDSQKTDDQINDSCSSQAGMEEPVQRQTEQGPNTLDIDFEVLAEEAPNSTVADMHRYFATAGVTQKNEYTGMFERYNLILITAEAFSTYAVHKEVTPTLYRLTQEGFVFQNFYTPLWGVSTSDGEYVACTGLIPKPGVWSFYRTGDNAMPFGFGNQFGRLGYHCYAYHDHTFDYYSRDISHPNMGYEYKGLGGGLELTETWPESDLEMMEVTIPEYIGQEPFHVYYMTVSGHMYYSFTGNSMSAKNREAVEELPYSEEAKAYLASQIELDRALEKLITELEKAGIADRTVIALSADHYPYGLEKKTIDELAGHEVEESFEIYRNHFILWTKSMTEPVVVDKVAGSMDIAPTLCNLFGLDYDSRLYMGRDILSEESKGLVIFADRSFITDKVMYNAATGEVTKLTEEELPADYIQKMNEIVSRKFRYSARIIETDYYQYILPYLAPES